MPENRAFVEQVIEALANEYEKKRQPIRCPRCLTKCLEINDDGERECVACGYKPKKGDRFDK